MKEDHISKQLKKICENRHPHYIGLFAAKRLRKARKILKIRSQNGFREDQRFCEIVYKRVGKKNGFERSVIGKIEGNARGSENTTILTDRASLYKYLPIFVEYYNVDPAVFLDKAINEKVFKERIKNGWKLLHNYLPPLLDDVHRIKLGYQESHTDDLLIPDWFHFVKIDALGNTKTSVKCKILNKTDAPVSRINFPIYSTPEVDIYCWVKSNGTKYRIAPNYLKEEGEGVLSIDFGFDLLPHNAFWLRWGYNWPKAYVEGEEWWEWYIARWQVDMRVTLFFANCWQISNLKDNYINNRGISVSDVQLKKNTIFWKIRTPDIRKKARLDFNLTKAK